MSDNGYEQFVRGLQTTAAMPLLLQTRYLHTRRALVALLNAEARRGKLVLVLGAGVSIPSGIAGWEEITQSLISAGLSGDGKREIARRLAKADLPPYRRTRILESLSPAFRLTVRDSLYTKPLRRNPTLQSLAALAKRHLKSNKTLRIVTYNFDNLLERALDEAGLKGRYLVVDRKENYREYQRSSPPLCIFHPHGYIPLGGDMEELLSAMLIFSERQYHRAYFSESHWSNVIQKTLFGSAACLFVGCSFNDQNLRRLLDQTETGSSPGLVAVMKRCDRFRGRRSNQALDYILQLDLGLLNVKTLWLKGWSGIPTILDQLLN